MFGTVLMFQQILLQWQESTYNIINFVVSHIGFQDMNAKLVQAEN